MNISLTAHFEELIKTKVESEPYNSVNEVIREALRLLEERDQVQALLREIHQGIDRVASPPPWILTQSKREGANGLPNKTAQRHKAVLKADMRFIFESF